MALCELCRRNPHPEPFLLSVVNKCCIFTKLVNTIGWAIRFIECLKGRFNGKSTGISSGELTGKTKGELRGRGTNKE